MDKFYQVKFTVDQYREFEMKRKRFSEVGLPKGEFLAVALLRGMDALLSDPSVKRLADIKKAIK